MELLVETGAKKLENYKNIIDEELYQEILFLAKNLKGARVLHLNSTAYGGGVAELLFTLVPLMKDVGLKTEWRVIEAEPVFFQVTKNFHNALQGMKLDLTEDMKDIFLQYNRLNAEKWKNLSLDYDFVLVHDPQPAAIASMISKKGKWIWRCHIDLTYSDPFFWNFLKDYLPFYDAAIFTAKEYVKEDLPIRKIYLIPPSIDPLSDKNRQLERGEILKVLENYGLNSERPIITQVSRFDLWKDYLGVIDLYREVKKEIPKVQLLMIGSMANDDPEGLKYYDLTLRHAGEDFDIFILTNFHGVGSLEVNAFQRASMVILQKSIREGFGLTVSEGLWKEKPVIGGNVGGIPLQIEDGFNGYLVDSIAEGVKKTLKLLKDEHLRREMGKNAKESVRKNFLMPRYLRDYLKLLREV